MNGVKNPGDVKPGQTMLLVQKQAQRTGKTTEGTVETILTKVRHIFTESKVRLVGNIVRRVA